MENGSTRLQALRVLNKHFKYEGNLGCLEDRQLKLVLDAMIEFSQLSVMKSFYCQRDIETESKCAEQCGHCKEYYAPLEKL